MVYLERTSQEKSEEGQKSELEEGIPAGEENKGEIQNQKNNLPGSGVSKTFDSNQTEAEDNAASPVEKDTSATSDRP